MSTIKELVDKHSKVPGDIRVVHPDADVCHWGRPYFYDPQADVWLGTNERSNRWVVSARDGQFELYTEPKPKVKRWLWAYLDTHTGTTKKWSRSDYFYTEDEIKTERHLNGAIKLEWSAQEFDE